MVSHKCKRSGCSDDDKSPCWKFYCSGCKKKMTMCTKDGYLFCFRCVPLDSNVYQDDIYNV